MSINNMWNIPVNAGHVLATWQTGINAISLTTKASTCESK
jgi:hypothetical protein